MSTQDVYLSQRDVIERVIRIVCRRHHLGGADADDFAGVVRLKLIENDCEVLRRFERRSSMQSFLVAVVIHLYQDFRNSMWGKWRPSAEARRLGPVAMLLEQLTARDGLSFQEAAETVVTNYDFGVTRAELEALVLRLPHRSPRRFVSEHVLAALPSAAGGDGDAALMRTAAAPVMRRATAAMNEALERLEPADRLLVKLRFYDGLSVARIARLQKLDQKPLYRRLERALAAVHESLNAAGFEDEQVTEMLRLDEATQE